MSSKQLGCYYCFKTLNPQSELKNFQVFSKCTHCGTVYHAVCWQQQEECLRCGNGQAQSIQVSPLESLPTITEMKALSVKPYAIAFSIGTTGIVVPDFVYKEVIPALQDSEIPQTIFRYLPTALQDVETLIIVITLIIVSSCSFCCLTSIIGTLLK